MPHSGMGMYVCWISPPHLEHESGTGRGAARAYKNQEIKPCAAPALT